ncbi:hypothetical protein H4582DRAFT_2068329 [Lactarius indigo]|nr:hypothetical protein H4582DRAFT_2068329 [Lactarius indigo]
MSQSPPSSSMSKTASSNLRSFLKKLSSHTKNDQTRYYRPSSLAGQLLACDSPTAVLTTLQGQVDQFIQSRSGDERLISWLNPTISVLCTLSATLGEIPTGFLSPAKAIFSGAGVLLLAARDVEASQGVFIEVFDDDGHDDEDQDRGPGYPWGHYKGNEVVEQKVAGIRKLEDGLKRLDKTTNEEARTANAEVLKVVHNIDKKMRGVDEVKVVEAKVQMVIDGDQQTAEILDHVKQGQLRERLRQWQSPLDLSTNYKIPCEYQHEGTTKWFFKGNVFEKWKVAGSLLRNHGKSSPGKSILCSAIIQDITILCDAGSASMAYFYFDFRNIDKRSRANLLPSLPVQLSACFDPFCDALSRLYEAHDIGTHRGSVYLVLDALDECFNTSGIPSSREQVLDLVKELVGMRFPSLHICATSRLEVDIRDSLESLIVSFGLFARRNGEKKDIAEYVRSMVSSNSVRALRRWRDADRDMIIKTLSERADGM